jgi:hypothetical protein
MTHCRDRVQAEVLFMKPASSEESWARTDLWDQVARIPGVARRVDVGGEDQRRFGARVSGEVFLFSPAGEMLFHGGITTGRGHEGDNQGRLALESLLLGQAAAIASTPAFGCELADRLDTD